jgi:hypothetical protein
MQFMHSNFIVYKLKSKGRARAKQRKLRAAKITRMVQQHHHEDPFQHFGKTTAVTPKYNATTTNKSTAKIPTILNKLVTAGYASNDYST